MALYWIILHSLTQGEFPVSRNVTGPSRKHLLLSVLPNSCSTGNFWLIGFSPSERTSFNVFYKMSYCTKTGFFPRVCEDYMVLGFCLVGFSSLYICAPGEHHRQQTALPLMDVSTFPQWLIFISVKR